MLIGGFGAAVRGGLRDRLETLAAGPIARRGHRASRDGYLGLGVRRARGRGLVDPATEIPVRSGGMRLQNTPHKRQSGRVSGRPDLPCRGAVVGSAAPLPGPGNVATTFLADGNSCLADTGRAS
jgi:hypothetical protein